MSLIGLGNSFHKQIIKFLPIKKNHRILDIACGTGTLTFHLANQISEEGLVTGVDIEPNMLNIAKLKGAKLNVPIKFIETSAEKLPFEDEYFDIITSTLAFHHLSEEQKLKSFNEIYRVLKKEGLFLLVDFGVPENTFVKIIALPILVDSFMKDNFNGILPKLLQKTGFTNIKFIHKKYKIIDYILSTKQLN
jgi:ubiquinone/menaquinone biosynthesis C-methylase UbiE